MRIGHSETGVIASADSKRCRDSRHVDSVSFVFGHNSLGLIPLFIAWGVTGLELWSPRESRGVEPAVATTD